MAILRISLADEIERQARDLATDLGVSTEQLAAAALQRRILEGRRPLSRRTLRVLSAAILVAALVVAFLRLLTLPAPLPTTGASLASVFLAALHWLRVFVQALLPWPLTLLAIAALFFRAPSAFGALVDVFGLFRKIKIFGAEIELTEQTKRKLETWADDIVRALREYGDRINKEVARLVSRHQLERELRHFIEEVIYSVFGRLPGSFRCTIHIPHPVLEGFLYQLLDYQPQGDGAYRPFSQRYGIIGKVWRSETSLSVGALFEPGRRPASHEGQVALIVREWGMDQRDAERALKKPSYVCFPLEHKADKLGVVYMDCEEEHAFMCLDPATNQPRGLTEQELDERVRKPAADKLGPKVASLLDDLSKASMRLDLTGYR